MFSHYHIFWRSNHKCSFYAQISPLEGFNHSAQEIHSGGTDGENEVFLFATLYRKAKMLLNLLLDWKDANKISICKKVYSVENLCCITQTTSLGL